MRVVPLLLLPGGEHEMTSSFLVVLPGGVVFAEARKTAAGGLFMDTCKKYRQVYEY